MLNVVRAQKSLRHLNAFINTPHALESNSKISSPLHGLTVAIKDNICTADLPTTCASEGLRNYSSPYDATVVAHIRNAGGIIAGKTNLDEFGMGSHSMHTAYGQVENHIPALSAGGSSGGSAVAVATGQCHAALGTDTGGSVRLPAAYNGIYGFKPSYGLLSRWGVVAYANSLDTVGILSSDLPTLRKIYSILNTYDPLDPTSISAKTRKRLFTHLCNHSRSTKQTLRIGVPTEYNTTSLSASVRHAWRRTLRHLHSQGHTLHAISLPTTRLALSTYYILAPAEASSNLAKYDGVRYGLSSPSSIKATALPQPNGSQAEQQQRQQLFANTRGATFHPEIQRRILLGTYTLSAGAMDNYFLQAQRIRRLIQQDFDSAFALPNVLLSPIDNAVNASSTDTNHQKIDVLIAPTAPTLPPSLTSLSPTSTDPVAAYATDVFTVPASLAGLPAISVPVAIPRELAVAEQDRAGGISEMEDAKESRGTQDVGGLGGQVVEWAGIQVLGQWGNDEMVLAVAELLEDVASKGRS